MKKRLILLAALLPLLAVTMVMAQTGLNVAPVLITNTSGLTQARAQLPFNLSSQALITGGWMDADALYTSMTEPYMPGTAQVRLLACFNDVAGDETAACNNATAGDLTLPTALNEVYEFAFDNQAKYLWLNVATAAVADWTVEWQYYNGSAYVALSNVSDGTNEFATAGLNRVGWDFPSAAAWPESTLHAIAGYWIRAEVTAVTSVTTPPTGTQGYYETGRWWTFAESMAPSEQRQFDLNLNTSTPRTFHHYFPNTSGITTPDEAGIEPGTSNWEIEITGYFDTSEGASKRILYKGTQIEITIPGEGIIQAQIYEAP